MTWMYTLHCAVSGATWLLGCITLTWLVLRYLALAYDWLIRPKGIVATGDKAVLVTGCDCGIGRALAEKLDELGFLVFAGCYAKDGSDAKELTASHPNIRVLQMDVTNQDQVADALTDVQQGLGDRVLWAVVNNAGIHRMTDIELKPIEHFRHVIETNCLGTVRVSKAFLPILKQHKGSRVINVTSVNGKVAFPYCSAYNMSKFANEAFSDNLRYEMERFGVHCSIIEIGNFGGATKIISYDRMKLVYESMYKDLPAELLKTYGEDYIWTYLEMCRGIRDDANPDMSPVIDSMVGSVRAATPQPRYLVVGAHSGLDRYTVAVYLEKILPERWMDRFLRMYFAGKHPKPVAAVF